MITTKTTFVAELPFVGTYGTEYNLDEAYIDEIMTEAQVEKFWEEFNFKEWFQELSQEYVEAFEARLRDLLKDNLDIISSKEKGLITFESCSSPKEYNFSTDRIFVHCDEELIDNFINYAIEHQKVFSQYLREKFTSCDGYIPYYPNETDKWYDNFMCPNDLDHNELGVLVDFFISYDADETQVDFSETKRLFLDDVYDYLQGNTDLLRIY